MKRYAKDHEWICIDSEGIASIGISQYATKSLGEITSVQLPEVNSIFPKGAVFGTVESEVALSEIYMPASGKVIAVNEQLEDFPQILNSDSEDMGWIIKIIPSSPEEIEELMTEAQYEELISKEDSAE